VGAVAGHKQETEADTFASARLSKPSHGTGSPHWPVVPPFAVIPPVLVIPPVAAAPPVPMLPRLSDPPSAEPPPSFPILRLDELVHPYVATTSPNPNSSALAPMVKLGFQRCRNDAGTCDRLNHCCMIRHGAGHDLTCAQARAAQRPTRARDVRCSTSTCVKLPHSAAVAKAPIGLDAAHPPSPPCLALAHGGGAIGFASGEET